MTPGVKSLAVYTEDEVADCPETPFVWLLLIFSCFNQVSLTHIDQAQLMQGIKSPPNQKKAYQAAFPARAQSGVVVMPATLREAVVRFFSQ